MGINNIDLLIENPLRFIFVANFLNQLIFILPPYHPNDKKIFFFRALREFPVSD